MTEAYQLAQQRLQELAAKNKEQYDRAKPMQLDVNEQKLELANRT